MTRVKRGTISRAKHKKLLGQTKGYRGTRNRLVKVAKEAALHAGQYAYHGRKLRKRDMRALWITRIGEAAKAEGTSYSKLMGALNRKNVKLDRKILAHLVTEDANAFKEVVKQVSK